MIIALNSVENVRDIGGIPTVDGRRVKTGLFLRGGHLGRISAEDSQELFGKHHVRCVVDLRCGYEHDPKPDQCPDDVDVAFIPFYDQDIVGIDYFEPTPGTITIGRDFACDPLSFYRHMTNELTVGQLRAAIHLILQHAMEGEGVYFHCSNGKDRAGVTAACLLLILGADKADILEDYLLTNQDRGLHYDKFFQRFLRLAQGDEEFAHQLVRSHNARPESLATYYSAIDERYGSMEEFIENQLGIDAELRARAIELCTE